MFSCNASDLFSKGELSTSYRNFNLAFALIVVSVITVFTVLFLSLEPQYAPSFVIAPIFSVVVIVILLIRRDYRVRFRELLEKYQIMLGSKSGAIFKYVTAVWGAMILLVFVFGFVFYSYPYLYQVTYVLYAFVGVFIAFVVSFSVFLAAFLKFLGKWGLLLIIIVSVIAIWRFLVWRLSS